MFHRYCVDAGDDAPAMVHVHGFAISGRYLEPTAALLARRYRTFVPDLPGMGRSIRPDPGPDIRGLARALIGYFDVMGIEKATLVGNSLGCPVIIEVATAFPERIERAVLVSPAGGPNNQPLARAIRQMAADGYREPPSMLPIAARDYLRFGALRSLSLFAAMTRYPTLESLPHLVVPTLVVAGRHDPLVRIANAPVLAVLPHVDIVTVPGAHALNFSSPELIADLVEAHMHGDPLVASGPRSVVQQITVDVL
ncbi:alpha/beta fold hydrolase [Xylanimonas sp. McL0601]|uniref:alpha/beta fold hydrolase n=1 Tax=Xylanimonas sp. McL0601 TaxID=3414739 RepID=UPI003CF85D39